jgi:hypothetical protein
MGGSGALRLAFASIPDPALLYSYFVGILNGRGVMSPMMLSEMLTASRLAL